ncbi:MAG: diacylglycerol kinase family protein [Bacteroidota bacterium]
MSTSAPPISDWLILLNPLAGGRKALLRWDQLQRSLTDAGISFDMVWTEGPGDAATLALEGIAQGYRQLMGVGGDGTVHEILQAIMTQTVVPSQEITFTVFPIGTGNDWARMYGISDRLVALRKRLQEGKPQLQDVGHIRFSDGSQRFFANVLGACYDAYVVEKTQGQDRSGWKGTVLYLRQLVKGLWAYQAPEIHLKGEGFERKGPAILVNAGICQYSGGGMRLVPEAIPDDGLLDITFVDSLGPWEVIRNLPKLYNGKLYAHPQAEHARSPWLEISSQPNSQIEADGELLGQLPARIELIPNALRVLP